MFWDSPLPGVSNRKKTKMRRFQAGKYPGFHTVKETITYQTLPSIVLNELQNKDNTRGSEKS